MKKKKMGKIVPKIAEVLMSPLHTAESPTIAYETSIKEKILNYEQLRIALNMTD